MFSFETQKRILDLIIASVLCVIFLPVWIVVPILIMLDSTGPIIFTHKRVGKNGKIIYLYKFRSMIKDADEILHKKDKELLKEFKKNDWKLRNDPRVTKLGKLLRALTIDEFPQLFNVFKGEMSMVGPRPHQEREVEKYMEYHRRLLTIKPGVTGMAQISGRSDLDFEKVSI